MDDCAFCKRIERGEYMRTVYPDVVTFVPLNPVTPGHRLFVPTRHVESAKTAPLYAGMAVSAAASEGFGDFNIITSSGEHATQTVFHLHVHLIPRRVGDGLHLPWTNQNTEGEHA